MSKIQLYLDEDIMAASLVKALRVQNMEIIETKTAQDMYNQIEFLSKYLQQI